jgi:hypothetical protein
MVELYERTKLYVYKFFEWFSCKDRKGSSSSVPVEKISVPLYGLFQGPYWVSLRTPVRIFSVPYKAVLIPLKGQSQSSL